MKKSKIALASLLMFVGIGSSFAFKAIAPGDVYYLDAANQYVLQCSITPPTSCAFASTTGTSGRYYTQPTAGTYVQLADNTSLFTIK